MGLGSVVLPFYARTRANETVRKTDFRGQQIEVNFTSCWCLFGAAVSKRLGNTDFLTQLFERMLLLFWSESLPKTLEDFPIKERLFGTGKSWSGYV